jgi:serine phosphatase RsbU (regulator of sigma subunit)
VPVLDRADRLRALTEAGLAQAPDPGMEHYARRVRRRLDVPVALVSLVTGDQQVFPGMVGLPEPWATARCTPLSHSFCQYVVASEEPLVVNDAREHPWVQHNLAVSELGVVAYAGMPLTDAAGLVLGSLCAIDTAPRSWTTDELDALADLAHGCSMELRLRLSRHDAARERERTDASETALRSALGRGQTLLTASQWLAEVSSVSDIRVRVAELVSTELAPTYIGMVLLGEDGRLHRIRHPDQPEGPEDQGFWKSFGVNAALPSATAVRERRMVHYSDTESLMADYPAFADGIMAKRNTTACTITPLLADGLALGALTLGWDRPREFSAMDLIVIESIAGYAAQAVTRVQLLEHRISVAHRLQRAMLGELPTVDGMDLGARYQPADVRAEVGGDWYDVLRLPGRTARGAGPVADSVAGSVAVSVGDIVGHDLHAATVMGQVRTMVRQTSWRSACASPAAVITDLESACAGVGLTATGTTLLARLGPAPGGAGRWDMTWTNAGHVPPLVLHGDGRTEILCEHDIMLGYSDLDPRPRRDHHVTLEPGSVLFFYTDGLVEQHGHDIDDGIGALRELLARLRGRPPQDLVDTVVRTLVLQAHDDTVALAIALGDP